MIMFGVAMLVTLGLAYAWVTRGFLSALLHMVCTILAGAIAFGVWEIAAHLVLENTSNAALLGSAWAIGLIVPFAVATVLLRVVTDAVVRNNAVIDGPLNYVGAGVCGLVIGTITTGILVIGIGTTRVGSGFLGYQPLTYEPGSLQRTGGLLLPIDRYVGAFYGYTSEAAFSTSEPLARYYPDPAHMAASLRMSDAEGKARNTAKPGDFTVMGTYTVGGEGGANGVDLLKDQWDPTPHNASTVDGDLLRDGQQKLLGVWINPNASMKERGGDIIFGEGQIFLVAETASGERLIRHPVAIVSPAQPASEGRYGRWRYNAKVFVALPGAAVKPVAFEFIVPPDAKPVSIFVKGLRQNVDDAGARNFPSFVARDSAIVSGGLIPGGAGAELDNSQTTTIGTDRGSERNREAIRDAGITVSRGIPLGMVIQKGTEGALTLNDDNEVVRGENKFDPSDMTRRGMARELRVNQFAVRSGTVLVQVEVSQDKPASLLGGAVAAAERVLPPVLVDDRGTQYNAIGWAYKDRDMVYLRYTPDQPIRGLTELQQKGVGLSRSRPDQQLVLIFEVTANVNIASFGIGGKEVLTFPSPIDVGSGRRR